MPWIEYTQFDWRRCTGCIVMLVVIPYAYWKMMSYTVLVCLLPYMIDRDIYKFKLNIEATLIILLLLNLFKRWWAIGTEKEQDAEEEQATGFYDSEDNYYFDEAQTDIESELEASLEAEIAGWQFEKEDTDHEEYFLAIEYPDVESGIEDIGAEQEI